MSRLTVPPQRLRQLLVKRMNGPEQLSEGECEEILAGLEEHYIENKGAAPAKRVVAILVSVGMRHEVGRRSA